jgi:hypothetical protein
VTIWRPTWGHQVFLIENNHHTEKRTLSKQEINNMAGKQNYQMDVEMLMTFTKTMSSNQVEV